MIAKDTTILKLNPIDFYFFTMEDVIPAMGTLITARFKEKQSAHEIRDAARYMISIHPRLRTVVKPTVFSYHLKVIDNDDKKLEILFNDCFRVKQNLKYGTEEYYTYRRNLYNESFSLMQGLPIKIRYLPDDSMPVLLLSVHHMITDGTGYRKLLDSLMAYLNGKKSSLMLPENTSLMPALLESGLLKIPKQLYRSFNNTMEKIRNEKKGTIISPTSETSSFFGPSNIYTQTLPYDLGLIKTKSKELDCTITVLLLAALTLSFCRQKKKEEGNIIAINIQIDLRRSINGKKPVLGNYVYSAPIKIHRSLSLNYTELIEEIKKELNQHLSEIDDKKIIFPILIRNVMQRIAGKKLFTKSLIESKKKGLFPTTAIFSNFGNFDRLNEHGDRAKLCEVNATAPCYGLLLVFSSMDDRITAAFSYQEAEFEHIEIKKIVKSFEKVVGELLEA